MERSDVEFEEKLIRDVEQAAQSYDAEVSEILKHIPGAEFESETLSGIAVKPLYTPADLKGTDFWRHIGFPGQYPYTRGAFAAGLGPQVHSRLLHHGSGTIAPMKPVLPADPSPNYQSKEESSW